MPSGAADTRHEYGSVLSLYDWVLAGWAGFVAGAILFAAVRYRARRRGEPSRRTDAIPLEVALAVAIAGFVALLLWKTATTEARIDRRAAGPAVRIDVTAFQWGWTFAYAGEAVSVTGNQLRPPSFAVPVGEPVRFTVAGEDVIHSFWIPDLRFKRDAIPGHPTSFDLVFPRAGSHAGRCAEFCGLEHATMSFAAVALPRAAFRRWLDERRG